jgi:Lon-like protease
VAHVTVVSTDEQQGPRIDRVSRLFQGLLSALTVVLVLIALAAIALWLWPSDYDLYLPHRAFAVAPEITIAGHRPVPHRGAIDMLVVDEQPVTNKLEQLFGALNGDATLVPRPQVVGTVTFTPQVEQHLNAEMMLSSEQIAKIVAWAHMGYRFPIRGVEITAIEPWSAARTALQQADVIVQAADQAITSTTKLQEIVRREGVGARISLVIERNDQRLKVVVRAVSNPKVPGHHAAIGVGILPFPDLSQLPRDPSITIDPGNIGGPSAGLAFTLEILQRFSRSDLTHGRRIAVTGALEVDGTFDAIGGFKQKTIGARWAGAHYFILPADNYAEARPYAHGLTLVPVHTIDEALAFLRTLR